MPRRHFVGNDALSGIHVINGKDVLRILSEGGGTRHLRTGVRKLTVRCG